MTIKLTDNEKLEMFHTSLCNIGGYLQGYGLNMNWDDNEYATAKKKLIKPCLEDVLIQVLKDGGCLKIEDMECDGEYNTTITLNSLLENIETTPPQFLIDMITKNNDVITADCIIQSVAYRKIIFG